MADPNIQGITFPVSYQGTSIKYVANINKQTGAMDVYEETPLGNRYFILTSYPGNNWKPELGPGALVPGNYSADQKLHILTAVSKAANNQRAAFINKNYTDPQKQQFVGMPKVQNTSNPDPSKKPDGTKPNAGGGTDPTSVPATDVEIAGKTKQEVGSYGNWIYPEGLGDNRQDFIEFMMVEYGGRKLGGFNIESGLAPRINLEKILGRVLLPIQPTISDMNSVDWQNDTINPLQTLLAQGSLDLQNSSFTLPELDVLKGLAGNDDIKRAIQLWAAGKAAGTNIMSRFAGAVVNPNMELLFNGPQLRPFNFSFRLSPRNEREAQQVKGIIRFFKKGMAIRKTDQELFLKAPNVFKIVYRNGNNENQEHTSINKIKICALTQCSVDYTPDGSYSVFYDKESTMTQYGLTLQFNELEPIFNEDYTEAAKTTIGY